MVTFSIQLSAAMRNARWPSAVGLMTTSSRVWPMPNSLAFNWGPHCVVVSYVPGST